MAETEPRPPANQPLLADGSPRRWGRHRPRLDLPRLGGSLPRVSPAPLVFDPLLSLIPDLLLQDARKHTGSWHSPFNGAQSCHLHHLCPHRAMCSWHVLRSIGTRFSRNTRFPAHRNVVRSRITSNIGSSIARMLRCDSEWPARLRRIPSVAHFLARCTSRSRTVINAINVHLIPNLWTLRCRGPPEQSTPAAFDPSIQGSSLRTVTSRGINATYVYLILQTPRRGCSPRIRYSSGQ